MPARTLRPRIFLISEHTVVEHRHHYRVRACGQRLSSDRRGKASVAGDAEDRASRAAPPWRPRHRGIPSPGRLGPADDKTHPGRERLQIAGHPNGRVHGSRLPACRA